MILKTIYQLFYFFWFFSHHFKDGTTETTNAQERSLARILGAKNLALD